MKDNAFPISSYLKSVFVECTVSFVFFLQSIHYSPTTTTTIHNYPSPLAFFISSYTKSIADAAAACIRNLYFLIQTNSFSCLCFVVVVVVVVFSIRFISLTRTKSIRRYICFVYSYCFHYFILNIPLKYCVKKQDFAYR